MSDTVEFDVDDDREDDRNDQDVRDVLERALKEFEADKEHDADNRREAYDDLRFLHDPYSQWLQEDRAERESAGRPCPVLARLQPFLKQVTNDLRMNKPGIEIKPVETDDRADADRIEGIIRHIETQSQARYLYSAWAENAVECGIGHVRGRIQPARTGPDQFDLVLEHIEDPLAVLWDRAATRRDRADARRCWVVDYLPIEDIEEAYGEALGEWPTEEEWTAWTDWRNDGDGEIRVVELYRMVDVKYRTYRIASETGIATVEIEDGEDVPEQAQPVSETTRRECRLQIMTAGKILEGGVRGIRIPGERIPVFPAIGSEKRVGRRMIRKGMVRDAKDSVRLINWSTALLIEAMATTPRAKYVGPTSAFQGLEQEWEQAATSPKAFLAYNDDAKAAPTYQSPPVFNAGLINALQLFDENIKQVTGIYDASLGARSNETSGKAIVARERQGDTATYDYIDNFMFALESLGRWMVEVVPEIYSDERTMRIVGRNDVEEVVTLNQIDPATGERKNPVERAVYDVTVKAGPNFSTRREEAAQGLFNVMQSAPNLAPILMDLLIQMQDWPNAEKVQKRLEMMLPGQIRQMEGIEGPPQEQQQPAPDPKVMAAAMKDKAAAEKYSADARAAQVNALIDAMEAGMPPAAALQLVFAPGSPGMARQGAPQQGQPPGAPQAL